NHKTAAVNIRENFHISDSELTPFSELVLQNTEITELVVLSTCNRMEIYFYHKKECKNKTIKQLLNLLVQFKNIEDDYSHLFYTHTNRDAVQHLFEVTSGIDSMIVGENQIVSQVKDCYLKATKKAFTDAVLMRLFQKSFETSKRVRSETKIQYGATSVSYTAIDMCGKKKGDLRNKNILLLGAGETGKIALSHLAKQYGGNYIIANRTLEKAEELSEQFGGNVLPFEEYLNVLPNCDIIIAATHASQILINKKDVTGYDDDGKTDQLFIDLSVPRNIDESINQLPGKEVLAVDDLQTMVDATNQIRIESIEQAGEIISSMVNEFYHWLEVRKLSPIIKSITQNVQKIHSQELEAFKNGCTREQIQIIESFGNRLSKKITNELIKQLKQLAENDGEDKNLDKIKELFSFNNN
ncbi:MAG: glutamyl-tRNA reductase, partial [Bacteroidales bacterium]|nr:glutamyl-tRNA reductase [Bacteroidales bacterium]